MENIIVEVIDNLKDEFVEFFSKTPKIGDVEEFTFGKLKNIALQLTKAYAEEVDAALYADKKGRRDAGLSVERKGDMRTIVTSIGNLNYSRTYYALKDGTYDYPVDSVLGVENYQRVSTNVVLGLAGEVKTQSYAKASSIVTQGNVSKQTVMNALRRCEADNSVREERRHVPVLHIDADEDHVSLQNGRSTIIPLVSVYEGLEQTDNGKHPRHRCINVFHISGMKPGEDFWDNVYERITERYDLRETKIYIHGDGAPWIKTGLSFFNNPVFVLDAYHRNKYKKMFFAGCREGEAVTEKLQLGAAFRNGDCALLDELYKKRMKQNPEVSKSIYRAYEYLRDNLDAIAVRYKDSEAKNGGATEPHVSHVLSDRLSSRPMGWSMKTLEHLVPMLASERIVLIPKETENPPEIVEKAAKKVSITKVKKNLRSLSIDPDRVVVPPVVANGQITQLYKAIKSFGR